jgi:hypothetical protein
MTAGEAESHADGVGLLASASSRAHRHSHRAYPSSSPICGASSAPPAERGADTSPEDL